MWVADWAEGQGVFLTTKHTKNTKGLVREGRSLEKLKEESKKLKKEKTEC